MAIKYVSNRISAGGTGTLGDPYRVSEIWASMAPGDEFIFLNGTYQGSTSLIDALVHPGGPGAGGSAGAFVVVRAETDGGVFLDGQNLHATFRLAGNHHMTFTGFNIGRCGNGSTVSVTKNSGVQSTWIELKRICAWDAPSDENAHTISNNGGENVLIEDCASWGVGRKSLEIFGTGGFGQGTSGGYGFGGTTIRRHWACWNSFGPGAFGPRHTYSLAYNYKNVLAENIIGTWDTEPGATITNIYDIIGNDGFTSTSGEGQSVPEDRHLQIYGSLSYLRQNQSCPVPQMFSMTAGASSWVLKDIYSCIEAGPNHTTKRAFLCSQPDVGNTGSLDGLYTIQNGTASLLSGPGWTYNNINEGGPRTLPIIPKYVNGLVVAEPLLPWPMNQRIIDARILSGRAAVDVTATVLAVLGIPAGLTYYIAPNGVDVLPPAGGTINTPWKTWSYAFAHSGPGDTLNVMDGTYLVAVNGVPLIAKICPSNAPYTVRAINPRVPLIDTLGSSHGFFVNNSAYIIVEGLRTKSEDRPGPNSIPTPGTGGAFDHLEVRLSNNITLRNCLCYGNNRWFNNHMVGFLDSPDCLAEDIEVYSFHRHAYFSHNAPRATFRRCYAHGRARADLPGADASIPGTPFESGDAQTGDSGFAIYPSGFNIIENCITENVSGAEYNASEANVTNNNRTLGCIFMGTGLNRQTSNTGGFIVDARADTAAFTPQNNVFKDVLIIKAGSPGWGGHGFNMKSALNTQGINCSVIDCIASGFIATEDGTNTGGGVHSIFLTNCLSLYNNSFGFFVSTDIDTWTIDYPRSFGNATNYSPSSSSNYQHKLAVEIDYTFPNNCYVWTPDGSPLKGAGLNGADIGANILYKYVNGNLTTEPLWNVTTGAFPYGPIIAGVNDVPGQSLFDVHTRLGILPANFPAGYVGGGPIPDTTPPAAPTGLQVT